MKNFNFKSILLGIGIGIILTSIISMIYLAGNDVLLDDKEIVKRAQKLGMVEVYADSSGEKKVDTQNEVVNKDKKQQKDIEDKKNEIEYNEIKDIDRKETEIKESEIKETEIKETEIKDQKKVTPAIMKKKIIVQAGDTSEIVSEKLKREGLIKNSEEFNDMVKEMGVSYSLTIGEYTIKSGAGMEEIIRILTSGG